MSAASESTFELIMCVDACLPWAAQIILVFGATRRVCRLLRVQRLDHCVGDIDGSPNEKAVLKDQIVVLVLGELREHRVEPLLDLVHFVELSCLQILAHLAPHPLEIAAS